MKTLQGTVISTGKMKDTITVLVTRFWQHPMYLKRIKRSKKYLVHSDKKIALNKIVKIGECRPISKRKRWKMIEVIKK